MSITTKLNKDDIEFLQERLNLVSPLFKPFVESQYLKQYKKKHVDANLNLLRSTKALDDDNLKCDIENVDILADKYARQITSICAFDDYIPSGVISIVAKAGIEMPDEKKHTTTGIVSRLKSPDWWKKQLYTQHIRLLEETAIKLGKVHAKSDKYISAESIKLYRARQRRNQAILEKMHAVNIETGEFFSLSEASKKSVSNPAIRRFEMMNRISGMDEKSVLDGMEAVFYTITSASRFHPINYKSGQINPNYDGATPRETHQHLCKKWALVRSAADRKNIEYTGIRVTEPHHDGTPHWHMLVFTKKHNIAAMTKLLKTHYLDSDEPSERGAKERRVTIELIDRKRGSAVGYVAKYISKNIDGYGLEETEVPESERVVSWSSLWGIRQFQFFGGPPVTVWREIRGYKGDEIPDSFQQLHELCKNSDWAGFMIMADENKIGCEYEVEKEKGVYGDDVKKVAGVNLNGETLDTSGDDYVFEFFDSSTDETYEYRF